MDEDVFADRSMEHRDKIAWMIETDGWALEPVLAQPDLRRPAYAYTIGVTGAFAFPEIVIVGLTPVASRGLVGLVVDLLRDGVDVPIDQEFLGLLDGEQRCALVPVHDHRDWFPAALDWYGGDGLDVVQFLWPDRNGFLPSETGFDQRLRMAQPVLSSTPPE